MPFSATTLTLCICFLTAISRVLLKLGFEKSNPLTGMVVSVVIGCLMLDSAALIFSNPNDYSWNGVLFFAGIGIVAPPVVRYLTYLGVHTLGAARSDPVRSLTPFFAILFAIIFLNEPFSARLVFAAFLIFSGVIALSRLEGSSGNQSNWRRWDLLYPLLAAMLAGGVANLRKFGSGLSISPLVGAASAATSALLVFSLFLFVTGKHRNLRVEKKSMRHFILSGICTSGTDVLDILALKLGKVSVVAPLLAASPLFIIAFSHLFLKRLEKVTPALLISALLIFLGVQVILFTHN